MRLSRIFLFLIIITALMASIALAGDAESGKKLFNDKRFARSTNAKSCNSCHPGGRGLQHAWEKSSFEIMGDKKESLEDTVNACIKMALKGKPIGKDSKDMQDITAYIRSLKGKTFKKKRKIEGC